MLSLPCCTGFSLAATSGSHSLVVVRGLTAVTSVAELGLWGTWASVVAGRALGSHGSGL